MLMLKIEVHPQVYLELENSRSWYEERGEKLGNEFLEEVNRAINTIKESPTTWTWYDKKQKIRRFFVHRFPYAVIYRLTSSAIQIIAVMHLHRKPDYWKKRLVN
jgi:plasmid stabilization system protein ParE